MPNSFATTKTIARQALPRLIDNLVMPNLCYKDYSDEFAKQGDTIRVRKPVILEAKDFVAGTPVTAQDVKEETVDVTLDKIASVDLNFEAIQMATNVDDLNRLAIEPAAVALAEKINGVGLDLYKLIPRVAGTAGTTPDGLDDLAEVRKVLNIARAPLANRVAIWDPEAECKFGQIGNLVKVSESGSPSVLRDGEIGRVYGIDNYMCQSVKTPTGTITAATAVKLNGATTAGTSTTLSIDATSLTGKLSVGDVIKVGSVYYTVKTESAAASTNAIASIAVNEPIQSHDDNTDVTLYSGGTQNLAFHKNAIAFVTRPLLPPAGVESYTTSYNGISLRVVRGYDMDYKREKLSIDVLYGYKVVYPELALRYLG